MTAPPTDPASRAGIQIRIRGIASYALVHDRPIASRVDDSVVRVIDGAVRVLRRAHGYAPAAIQLPAGFEQAPEVRAYGGDPKAAFCLVTRGQAILSQHLGDLADLATRERRASRGATCMRTWSPSSVGPDSRSTSPTSRSTRSSPESRGRCSTARWPILAMRPARHRAAGCSTRSLPRSGCASSTKRTKARPPPSSRPPRRATPPTAMTISAIRSRSRGCPAPACPHMFRAAQVMLLHKIDLLPHVEFDVAAAIANAKHVNPAITVLCVSARTGEGLAAWYAWIDEQSPPKLLRARDATSPSERR